MKEFNPTENHFFRSVTGGRPANEDSCAHRYMTPNGDLFVVCDGMGGHVGGAVASKIAVDSICGYFEQKKYPEVEKALADALEFANIQILAKASETPELHGMGTTACVVLIQDGKIWFAHCGDSRIYLYSAGEKWLHRITKDHSFVQLLVDTGEITDEQAETHPQRNRITRALGIQPGCNPEVCVQPALPAKGDVILICSDGLSGSVKDVEMQEILSQPVSIAQKGELLLSQAEANGWTDNVTVQLIRIPDSSFVQSVYNCKNPKNRKVPAGRVSELNPSELKGRKSKKKAPLIVGIGVGVGLLSVVLLIAGGWFAIEKTNLFNKRGESTVVIDNKSKKEKKNSPKTNDRNCYIENYIKLYIKKGETTEKDPELRRDALLGRIKEESDSLLKNYMENESVGDDKAQKELTKDYTEKQIEPFLRFYLDSCDTKTQNLFMEDVEKEGFKDGFGKIIEACRKLRKQNK